MRRRRVAGRTDTIASVLSLESSDPTNTAVLSAFELTAWNRK